MILVDLRTSDLLAADSGAGFAAGSRANPTSATVTLLDRLGGGPGLTPASGWIVTAYNTYPTAIPANKTIWLSFSYGQWYLVQSEC